MSFRSLHLIVLGLAALAACDQGLATPTAVDSPLRIERACMSPLQASDGELNAVLVVELADKQHLPGALVTPMEHGGTLTLLDDGLGVDAVAADGRFSAPVAGPAEVREGVEQCGEDLAEIGLTVAPLESAPTDGSGDMFHNCPFRPLDEYECVECGGQWRRYYYCDYWYGCYFMGWRCYGW